MLDSAPFNTAGTSVPSDPGVVSAITAQSHELSCKSAGANFGRMQCQSRSSSVAFHLEKLGASNCKAGSLRLDLACSE